MHQKQLHLWLSVFITVTVSLAHGQGSVQLAEYPGAPLEDRFGNLWFGTVLEGLIRYDGHEFVHFTTEDGLGSNMIRGMLESDDGTLWFGTSGGLTKYDGEKFTVLTEYEPMKVTQGWGEHGNHRDLKGMLVDSQGKLWIATLDGVFRYDNEVFKRFPMPVIAAKGKFEFAPKMVSCIFEDADGDYWFGTDGAGIIRYDGIDWVIYTMESHGLSSDNISRIVQDSTGNYWFGTSNGGVTRYDGKNFTTHLRSREFSQHSGWGRFLAIHEDQQGYIWFGAAHAGGGVYRYDGESFEYLSEDAGLGNGGVPSIREDRNGVLWFGTTSGVYHFDGDRFINFTKDDPKLPLPQNPLKGWASETFALPPGFAPELPVGVESLRFTPGWRDPDSEDFWGYAFVMWIQEDLANTLRVQELITQYYTGLMSAFGVGENKQVPLDHVKVLVEQISPNQYEARMTLIDGFATFEPIELRVLVETLSDPVHRDRSYMRVQISSQLDGHPVWESLGVAVRSIEFVQSDWPSEAGSVKP